MRAFVLLGVSALALGACHVSVSSDERSSAPARVVSRLTCPERQGDLLRSTVSADGRICNYTAPNGGDVTVRLVAVEGSDARAALTPIEADLRTLVPPPPARAVDAAGAGARADVDIDLPFFRIRAGDESAQVRMPGVSVDANGQDATVNVDGRRGETVQVNTRGGASEVRVNQRSREVRSTYILSREEPSAEGWRLAGYRARGPQGGPIVVAVARSRAESHQLIDQLDELIDASFSGDDARADRASLRAEADAERISARAERDAARAEARADRAAARAERDADRAAARAERAAQDVERMFETADAGR